LGQDEDFPDPRGQYPGALGGEEVGPAIGEA